MTIIFYCAIIAGGVVGIVNPIEPQLSPIFVITESDVDQDVDFCVELLSGGQLQRAVSVQIDVVMQNGTGNVN